MTIEELFSELWSLCHTPIVAQLIAAMVLSSLIGLERGLHGRAAGMRTNMLVGTGAALFTIISIKIPEEFMGEHASITTFPDPGRIAAQIVSGIGFLGAGAIIKSGTHIKGLTTASCLWVVAAIGVTCGTGHILLATFVSLAILTAMVSLAFVSRFLPRHSYRTLILSTHDRASPDVLSDKLKKLRLKVQGINSEYNVDDDETKFVIQLRSMNFGRKDLQVEKIYDEILSTGYAFKKMKWIKNS